MLNPLLTKTDLPLFEQIKLEQVIPTLKKLIETYDQTVAQITSTNSVLNFETLVQPLEALDNKIERVFAPIAHLNAVQNTQTLREVYEAALGLLSEHSAKVGQNLPLYQAFVKLTESVAYAGYTPAQKKVVENSIRDFKRAGVALEDAQKQQYIEYVKTLSQLETQFSQNLLDATQAWCYHTKNRSDLSGLPEHAIVKAQAEAQRQKKSGFILTLEYPSYSATVTYAENRALREQIYTAYITRASELDLKGQCDNHSVMERIILTRQQKAQLLRFSNYTEYALETRMASSSKQVQDFLENLVSKIKEKAQEEYDALKAFAKTQGLETLAPWDLAFYAEKLKQRDHQVSQEAFRPFFPEENVLTGLFGIVQKLYGLEVVRVFDFESYHPDLKLFEVYDADGVLRGRFYLDLYARENKRDGAWMGDCITRFKLPSDQIQIPVVFVVTNFSAPVKTNGSLLTHDEVITLFHEFGHCLHHILTTVDYFSVAGGNGVEWDAIELPSQFLENWAWEWEAVQSFAKHYKTGEPLAKAEFDKLRSAKHFQVGCQLMRQLEFALFDLQLHTQALTFGQNKNPIRALLNQIRKQVSVIPTVPFNRFENSFSHIFSGGYAAGYYSYLWAEVLSSDAFEKFEEAGIFNAEVGQLFLKHILEAGGVGDAMRRYVAFRGRTPTQSAFLKHRGLL